MLSIDSLTGLYNQAGFLPLLQKKLDRLKNEKDILYVLFIEFDDLARFNDVFGADVDEQLLAELAQVVRSVTSQEDSVGRIGNYGFVLASDTITTKDEAEKTAQEILNLLCEPFSVADNMFYVTASIGISFADQKRKDAVKVLKIAENTMRHAQKKGTNHIAFASEKVDQKIKQELRLMKDLPSAIDNREFTFVYQGQYSHQKKRFTGAEILIRWDHPAFGVIGPDIFIPFAEKSGMIGPMTTMLLIEASEMFQRLEEKGIHDFSLSVNISSYVLMEKSFLETIEFLLENYSLKGRKLHFEIMEDTIAGNLENFSALLHQIKNRGIGIEIDDYGTGHTSLNYLIALPVDILKIDRTFVSGIDQDEKKFALLSAMIDMAKALAIDVILEGIENAEEDKKIQLFQNVTTQGYFYCKPVPRDALIALLEE